MANELEKQRGAIDATDIVEQVELASRRPADLPAFCAALVDEFAGAHAGRIVHAEATPS